MSLRTERWKNILVCTAVGQAGYNRNCIDTAPVVKCDYMVPILKGLYCECIPAKVYDIAEVELKWQLRYRKAVYYLSVAAAGFLILIIALAVVRLVVFCALWALTFGKHHLWLFPNLTEDVGFLASFWPIYQVNHCNELCTIIITSWKYLYLLYRDIVLFENFHNYFMWTISVDSRQCSALCYSRLP